MVESLPFPTHPEMTPPEGTQALLFDCDGTLVDTLSLYKVCWHQTFGRYGFELTDEWFATVVGNDVHTFAAAAFPDASEELRQQIIDEGMALFMASTHLLEPFDHVVQVAREYHGRLPLAVVSSGLRHAVIESLEAVGILDLFDHVFALEDVEATKPAPDGYLLAMSRLGVDPAFCVAYEDSTTGIESARAAGIPTVVDVRWHDA